MNSNPLSHVGQTARPEESPAPETQSGDAGGQTLPQHPREKADEADEADAKLPMPPAKKEIPDLKPGDPPPESSAGS